jgi:TetR/AcrR family transcriptional repressor of mexCD-oprJ operon
MAKPSGANPSHLRADAARNRRAILDAAMRSLAAEPSVRLDQIATAAGVTRTTLYRHFRDREELVNAVFLEALEGVSRALADAHLEQGPVPAAFQRVVDAVLRVTDQYQVLIRGPSPDLADPELIASYEQLLAPVAALAGRGQASGELAADLTPAWIAETLIGLLLFTALPRLAVGALRRDEVAPLVLRTFWSGVDAS